MGNSNHYDLLLKDDFFKKNLLVLWVVRLLLIETSDVNALNSAA